MSSFTISVDEASPLLGEEGERPTRRRIGLAIPFLVWFFLCTSCLAGLNALKQRYSVTENNLWDDDGSPSTGLLCSKVGPVVIYETSGTCKLDDGPYNPFETIVMIKTTDLKDTNRIEYHILSKDDSNNYFAYGTITHVNGWGDVCTGRTVPYDFDDTRNTWTPSRDNDGAYEWVIGYNAATLHVSGKDCTCTFFRANGENCRRYVRDFVDSFPKLDERFLDGHPREICDHDL